MVAKLIKEAEQQIQLRRIQSWKARMEHAPEKQSTWVKTYAEVHVSEMRAARPSPSLVDSVD